MPCSCSRSCSYCACPTFIRVKLSCSVLKFPHSKEIIQPFYCSSSLVSSMYSHYFTVALVAALAIAAMAQCPPEEKANVCSRTITLIPTPLLLPKSFPTQPIADRFFICQFILFNVNLPQCLVNPCDNLQCIRTECVANYCGGCFANCACQRDRGCGVHTSNFDCQDTIYLLFLLLHF